MKYIVKSIQEADFGCEERPEGIGAMALVRLCDETGCEMDIEVKDADLVARDINEGDLVFFDEDNTIHKSIQGI